MPPGAAESWILSPAGDTACHAMVDLREAAVGTILPEALIIMSASTRNFEAPGSYEGDSGVPQFPPIPRALRVPGMAVPRSIEQEFRHRLAGVLQARSWRKLEDFGGIERIGNPHG